MALSLSSVRIIVEASGTSRDRCMASNSQRVVQRPQPIHLFWSTTVTPQPRQRDASSRTCSSVNGLRSSEKVLTLFSSTSGLCRAGNSLEKLWVLYDKYLALADYFGPHLLSAMFTLELEGKLRFTSGVDEYLSRYIEWFVRFVRDCQAEGVIRNGGRAEKLVPVGEKLAFFVVFEWCASGGAFDLRERAFDVIEDFYDVAPERRGLRL